MDDRKGRRVWQIIWVSLSILALTCAIAGSYHHFITSIIAMIMAVMAGINNDDNQLKTR